MSVHTIELIAFVTLILSLLGSRMGHPKEQFQNWFYLFFCGLVCYLIVNLFQYLS